MPCSIIAVTSAMRTVSTRMSRRTGPFVPLIVECCRAFSIDTGVVNTPETSEHSASAATLMNELQRVKEDLKHKDSEIRRANEIRENTDREIEELTASLFEVSSSPLVVLSRLIVRQSAHSMVEQAKYAQANAEQKLRTANQTVRGNERGFASLSFCRSKHWSSKTLN